MLAELINIYGIKIYQLIAKIKSEINGQIIVSVYE